MKRAALFRLVLMCTGLPAQTIEPVFPPIPAVPVDLTKITTPVPPPRNETFLTLMLGGDRLPAESRVTVPAGEKLHLTLSTAPSFGSLQWRKDGQSIAGATTSTLTIENVAATDAGTYEAVTVPPPGSLISSFVSQSLILMVGPIERLLNLSARGWVSNADQPFVVGFVVGTSGKHAKKIIVRAIGPTLTRFGVPNALAQPVIEILDSKGKPWGLNYGYNDGSPEKDLADSLARCGAFALPAGTKDVTELRPFEAGSYTVQVTSRDGLPGAVLLEIYEVP